MLGAWCHTSPKFGGGQHPSSGTPRVVGGLGAPLRNEAWEKWGGAWGLPVRGLAGGGGRPPKLCREGEGPTCACDGQTAPQGPPRTLRMRAGQPDPLPPSRVCGCGGALGHERRRSQPGRGLRGTSPLGVAGERSGALLHGCSEPKSIPNSAALIAGVLGSPLESSGGLGAAAWPAGSGMEDGRGTMWGDPKTLLEFGMWRLHAPYLGSRVYVRHAGTAWVSFGGEGGHCIHHVWGGNLGTLTSLSGSGRG